MPDGSEALRLEGKVAGPAVRELQRLTENRVGPLGLDLSRVSFVDADGAVLLRDLVGRGIEIVDSSAFVAELLRRRTS